MRRVALGLIAATAALTISAAPAFADPPSVHDLDLTELEPPQIQCGGRTLTLTRGTLAIREHLHELGGGKTRIVFVQRMRDGRFADGEGGIYRARAVSTGNIVFNEATGSLGGHVNTKYILHGEGFRGVVNETIHVGFEDVIVSRGSCSLIQ
jgi:hypothetical protein